MHEYITDLSEVVTVAEKQLASGTHASWSNFHIYFRQLLEDKDVDFIKSDLPSLVNDCVEGGARVKDIIQSLKDFSRRDHNNDEFQLTNLHIIITKTLNLLRNEIKYDVDLKVDCDPDLYLEALPGPLSQVLSNILINATHAIRLTERRGFIQVVAFHRKHQVILKITDNGCGIHPDHQKSVFDPFFTTKKAGEGTGLGMNIAYDIIVNRHGGQLSVKSELGVGTEFFIELPMNPNRNRQSASDAASSLTTEGV
jgi:two-component system NtrC family sensor kinase